PLGLLLRLLRGLIAVQQSHQRARIDPEQEPADQDDDRAHSADRERPQGRFRFATSSMLSGQLRCRSLEARHSMMSPSIIAPLVAYPPASGVQPEDDPW